MIDLRVVLIPHLWPVGAHHTMAAAAVCPGTDEVVTCGCDVPYAAPRNPAESRQWPAALRLRRAQMLPSVCGKCTHHLFSPPPNGDGDGPGSWTRWQPGLSRLHRLGNEAEMAHTPRA